MSLFGVDKYGYHESKFERMTDAQTKRLPYIFLVYDYCSCYSAPALPFLDLFTFADCLPEYRTYRLQVKLKS